MRKEVRKEQIRKRKNFFPTLVVTIILWLLIGSVVYFVEPDTFGIIYLFFVLVSFAFLFTFSTLFANSRRGFLSAIGLTTFLVLKYMGVGNIINFLLILALVITTEMYFSKR